VTDQAAEQPTGHRRRILVALTVPAVLILALYLVRPGVVENGVRSPRVWLVVAAVVVTGRALAYGVRRLTGRPRLASALGHVVVAVAGIALLAPSFQQRTLVEALPMAVDRPATSPAGPAVASPPVASPPVAGGPATAAPVPTSPPSPPDDSPRALRSAGLQGVGHSASGTTTLYATGDQTILAFEEVDIEGTPAPFVYLVPAGSRSPEGGVALGPLKAERGSFSYPLPADVDASEGWSVLVWCRTFATPIAAAEL
jgi:hypothetical protein